MSLFDSFKKKIQEVFKESAETIISRKISSLVEKAHAEFSEKHGNNWWSFNASDSPVYREEIVQLNDEEKVIFIVQAVTVYHRNHGNRDSYSSGDYKLQIANIYLTYMQQLLRTRLTLKDEDFEMITAAFATYSFHKHNRHILYWPVNLLVGQLEKHIREKGCSDNLKITLNILLSRVLDTNYSYYQVKEMHKTGERLKSLILAKEGIAIKPTWFLEKDEFGKYANAQLKRIPEDMIDYWFSFMILAEKSSGAKPTNIFLKASGELIKAIGEDRFKKLVYDWFHFYIEFKATVTTRTVEFQNQNFAVNDYSELDGHNLNLLKAFVWACVHFQDKPILNTIALLAERCYRKLPGQGATAVGLGNACFYTLANTKGLEGVAHLSKLKLRIKQSNTQTLIEKYLKETADRQGVSVHDIEDLAVDDFGLENDQIEFDFDGYKALLKITAIGKTSTKWFKPDGTEQKSVPVFVKEKHNDRLKELKAIASQIETTLTVQRDRLDRMLKAQRQIPLQQFNELYLNHGLMQFICRKLIWKIVSGDSSITALYRNGHWIDQNGLSVADIGNDASFVLWHPVMGTMEQVLAWREWLSSEKIQQPIRQAYREVYLLTDAEINTRTYSNRMAAHILKQHQFSTLAKGRGWKYSLLGVYDDGRNNETASLILQDYNLKAEFWVTEVNADEAYNDTGIWNYVATDQIRFTNLQNHEPEELISIPPVIFSEVMRDTDLFVGVASVGNDPNWRDNGGLPAYRDYWQSYSFGDLNEIAKTRKSILEKLVPRLAISGVSEIRDKFLVVKGKIRTYKIHIGSTNILMEPNDQYLCIVPDRSVKPETENLFIPFEGDNGLSVILSKAFLLAADDKIKDPTIVRQLK